MTQIDKYGRHVTFAVSSQYVIRLVVIQDKPEFGLYTKRPSVTSTLTQGHIQSISSQKAINTGPDPYICTLSLKHTALTIKCLYHPKTAETHTFCPVKGAWPEQGGLLTDTRKQHSSHKHTGS